MKHYFYLRLAAVFIFSPLAVAEEAVIPDPNWKVARAQFTTAIENREPVDELVILAPPFNEVFFFTDLRHLQGRTVTHRWEFKGELISQKAFEVGGARWRVYSKVVIQPSQVGEWSVTVVDQSGWPLYTELFRYDPLQKTGTLESPQGHELSE
jgi:hypothetical protein